MAIIELFQSLVESGWQEQQLNKKKQHANTNQKHPPETKKQMCQDSKQLVHTMMDLALRTFASMSIVTTFVNVVLLQAPSFPMSLL